MSQGTGLAAVLPILVDCKETPCAGSQQANIRRLLELALENT